LLLLLLVLFLMILMGLCRGSSFGRGGKYNEGDESSSSDRMVRENATEDKDTEEEDRDPAEDSNSTKLGRLSVSSLLNCDDG
jgi:hypothetical protein